MDSRISYHKHRLDGIPISECAMSPQESIIHMYIAEIIHIGARAVIG